MITEEIENKTKISKNEEIILKAPEYAISVSNLSVFYGTKKSVENVNISIIKNEVTSLIGPSGCGKSTFLRCLNRMNDLIINCKIHGKIEAFGNNIYNKNIDVCEVRKQIGMVFQKPNPFPKSIFENVAFPLKIHGIKKDIKEKVEESLRKASLWDEVKDRLHTSASSLSGGQQQRLCIARAMR